MQLITEKQKKQLVTNGLKENIDKDHKPVVKLFLQAYNCVWLLTYIDSYDLTTAYGICDLGQGYPEFGSVNIKELEDIKIGIFKVERDKFFTAKYPFSVYHKAALGNNAIIDDQKILEQFI